MPSLQNTQAVPIRSTVSRPPSRVPVATVSPPMVMVKVVPERDHRPSSGSSLRKTVALPWDAS